jgi:hypothetical protein
MGRAGLDAIEKRKILLLPGTSTFQHLARCYTDWAVQRLFEISAHIYDASIGEENKRKHTEGTNKSHVPATGCPIVNYELFGCETDSMNGGKGEVY